MTANFHWTPQPGNSSSKESDKLLGALPYWASINPMQVGRVLTWEENLVMEIMWLTASHCFCWCSYCPIVIGVALLCQDQDRYLQGELQGGAGIEMDVVVCINGGPQGTAQRLVSSEVTLPAQFYAMENTQHCSWQSSDACTS